MGRKNYDKLIEITELLLLRMETGTEGS